MKLLVRGTQPASGVSLQTVGCGTGCDTAKVCQEPTLHTCWCSSSYTTRCPVLHFWPPMSYTLAVPRAIHSHSPSLPGKGNSGLCCRVSMVNLDNSLGSFLPRADSISHSAHPMSYKPVLHMLCPGSFCSIHGCQTSALGHVVAF